MQVQKFVMEALHIFYSRIEDLFQEFESFQKNLLIPAPITAPR